MDRRESEDEQFDLSPMQTHNIKESISDVSRHTPNHQAEYVMISAKVEQ